jgi:localization factor PodJL
LTHQVREARDEAVSTAERVARAVAADLPQAGGDVSAFRRDLETLHAHQAETDQRTQETLEAVHDTLERLVERLASVETGLHGQRPAAAPAREPEMPEIRKPRRSAPLRRAPRKRRSPQPPAIIPQPHAPAKPAPFMHVQRTERPPIDPDLPADTPLEPGHARTRGRTPAERIAASEAALGPALGTLKREGEVAGKANFIAAARRAAQAAANEGVRRRPARRGAQERSDPDQPDRALPRQPPARPDARRERAAGALRHDADRRHDGRLEPARGTAARRAEPDAGAGSAQDRAPPAPAAAPAAAPEPAAPCRARAEPPAEPLIAPTPTASLIAPTPVGAPASQPAPAPVGDPTGSVKPPLNIAGACGAGRSAGRAGFRLGRQAARRDRRSGAANRRGGRQSGRRIRDRGALLGRPRRDGRIRNSPPNGSTGPPSRASRRRSIASAACTRRAMALRRT